MNRTGLLVKYADESLACEAQHNTGGYHMELFRGTVSGSTIPEEHKYQALIMPPIM